MRAHSANGFLSAGRTDRGVHACGQIIAFSTAEPERAVAAINARLPPDCWCTGYSEVPALFHPRYDARSRTYRYYTPDSSMDVPAMDRASRSFLGSHNFTNFARVQGRNPCRNILDLSVREKHGFICFEVKAESFLWHQVRCMASALFSVGTGEADEGSIARLLKAEADRPIQPAPAEGLVLWDIDCGLSWSPMPSGERSEGFMDQLIRHHATMGQVCRVLRQQEPS